MKRLICLYQRREEHAEFLTKVNLILHLTNMNFLGWHEIISIHFYNAHSKDLLGQAAYDDWLNANLDASLFSPF